MTKKTGFRNGCLSFFIFLIKPLHGKIEIRKRIRLPYGKSL